MPQELLACRWRLMVASLCIESTGRTKKTRALPEVESRLLSVWIEEHVLIYERGLNIEQPFIRLQHSSKSRGASRLSIVLFR